MTSPAQNPAFDFFEAAQLQLQDNRTIAFELNALRFVPGSLRDQSRGERIKLQLDLVFLLARMSTETSTQKFADRKIGRPMKTRARQAHIAHARQRKGPQLPALEIVPEEVPLILEAGEMIGSEKAQFEFATAQLAIFEMDFDRTQHRFADGFKSFQIGRACSGAAERDDAVEIAPGEGNAIGQAVRDFAKGGTQRLLRTAFPCIAPAPSARRRAP